MIHKPLLLYYFDSTFAFRRNNTISNNVIESTIG